VTRATVSAEERHDHCPYAHDLRKRGGRNLLEGLLLKWDQHQSGPGGDCGRGNESARDDGWFSRPIARNQITAQREPR
jgi:hypothetical protein